MRKRPGFLPLLLLSLQVIPMSLLQAEPLSVRVVNGKTGRPVSDETLQVWVDQVHGDAIQLHTDQNGVGHLNLPQSASLIISSNLYLDCRNSKKAETLRPAYLVSEILTKGTSGTNKCGHLNVQARPGELLFFVRPEHWWEGIGR